jgi:A/G-specific adenine glycosylase
VLKAWEGLGYYTRARNLQKATQQVVQKGGTLPTSSSGWAELPGIGPYTAAAISSISFGEYAPVVDGNVARVFARILEWRDDFQKLPAREKLAAWLQPFIEKSKRPGDFNQAMMDLGATICTPRNPNCTLCPLRATCLANAKGLQEELPFKPPRKKIPLRFAVALKIQDERGRLLFAQRVDEKLLAGLWELPSQPFDEPSSAASALRLLIKKLGLSKLTSVYLGEIEHAFSHFKSVTKIYGLKRCVAPKQIKEKGAVAFKMPTELPLTTVTRRALAL